MRRTPGNKILDLTFRYVDGDPMWKFWGWNGVAAISGTCHFVGTGTT